MIGIYRHNWLGFEIRLTSNPHVGAGSHFGFGNSYIDDAAFHLNVRSNM